MPDEPKKQKLDELMVALGFAPDLAKARALIMAGQVVVNDQRCEKPGTSILSTASIRLKGDPSPYVGRGGQKLAGVLDDLDLDDSMRSAVVLDVGASTGGFTDVCLQLGARKVIAVDVGTNQMAWSLRRDPRVDVREQTDIRALAPADIEPVDWVVADVSFISLTSLIPALLAFGQHRPVRYLLLVKPQFELPKEVIPKGGVVTDELRRAEAVQGVIRTLKEAGVPSVIEQESRLPGREGNREVFLYFQMGL